MKHKLFTRFLILLVLAIMAPTIHVAAYDTYSANNIIFLRAQYFSHGGGEEPENLLDGDRYDKWCSWQYGEDGGEYEERSDFYKDKIVWKTSEPIALWGYILTSANDTRTYMQRQWKSWTIYGGNFSNDGEAADYINSDFGWNIIHQVIDDDQLSYDAHKDTYYDCYPSAKYTYFRLVLDAIHQEHGDGDVQQMSELTMLYSQSSVTAAPTAKSLVYSGTSQQLVNAGTASGGTMQYRLGSGSWSTSIPTATNAGTYTVYYKVVGDNTHTDNPGSSVSVTINKAALSITADNKSITFGDAAPTYTATYSGWKNNETTSVLSGSLSFACSYAAGNNIGNYTITPSGVTASNYTITFHNGTLTVNKANATIASPPAAINNLVYDGNPKTLVTAGTAAGGTMQYKLDDGAFSTTLPTATDARTYTVYYKVVGDANHNDNAGSSVSVTISKAPLSITADDKEITYGDAAPTYTASYSGWQGSDNTSALSGTLAFDCDYSAGDNVGEYTITPSGVTASNYEINFVPGTLVVGKPTPTITGNADPQHPGTYYSTFYYGLFKYLIPSGVEAYGATIVDGDLYLKKIAGAGDVLPKATAVILKSSIAGYTMVPTDDEAITITEPNALQGADEEMSAPANCYVLSGHSTDNSVTGVGFYQYTGTLKAHRAYVVVGNSAPKRMRFVFDTETDIESVEQPSMAVKKYIENGMLIIEKNGVRYNIQGQIIK